MGLWGGYVGSREAAFEIQPLIKKALSYKIASVKIENLRSEIKTMLSEGVLHGRTNHNGNIVFATNEAVQLENKIITQIKEGKNQVNPLLSQAEAKAYLNNTTLSQGQKNACELIATTTDRFVMIQGYAGTGKSTMLQTLIGDRTLETLQALLPRDVEVMAIAPTHKAVLELNDKGIKSQTLKSFLVDYSETSNASALKNKLIIVDESSMISNTDFYHFQSIVEKQGARCPYLGDIAQLSAVGAGKPSEISYISKQADIATAIMTENKRQTNPELKMIADLLMQGSSKANFEKAFALLDAEGYIVEINDDQPDGFHSVIKTELKNKNNAEKASAIKILAQDYVALSQSLRAETLIAAATNNDRIALNNEIRDQLKAKGELEKVGININILDDSRLTEAELLHAENYELGMIVKYQGEYKDVTARNIKNNLIILCDANKVESMLSLSYISKSGFIELFSKRTINICKGDSIKFTKTDRENERQANTLLQVESVNVENKTITAKTSDGEIHSISIENKSDQHIDHSYSSTTHGLQAATSQAVFILSSSYNKLSNTMRQMYVAVTRAREKAIIYTDNKSEIKNQIINNAGEKASALEAMGLLEKRSITSINKLNKINTVNTISVQEPEKRIPFNAKLVEKNLSMQAKQVVQHILGEPNHTLSSATNWRYGKKGSFSIMVEGDKAGRFHNFETGEKGGMINLIMSELRLPFKEALEHASQLLGGSHQLNIKHNNPSLKNTEKLIDVDDTRKKQQYMNTLIEKSKPIEGTLAEIYLRNRAIIDTKNTTLRFLEHVITGGGNRKIPFSSALIAIAHDENNNPKAIQLTYLDKKTGAKIPELSVAKRTLNSPDGSFVNLTPAVKTPEITFVAEGVETALSIRDAAASIKNAQVIATLLAAA